MAQPRLPVVPGNSARILRPTSVVSEGEGVTCGVGGGRGDLRAVGAHDLAAEGLLLVADLDHVDLAVQAQVGAGHGQGGAPLAGAGLGGHALEALVLGVEGLGDGGIELMGAGGVVALELVVDLRRGLQLLLQAVGPDQGRGPVHLVEIADVVRDGDVGRGLVQLLPDELVAEDGLQILKGDGLARGGIEEGGGLVDHVGAEIVPCLGHLIFGEVDLVGDFVFHD